MKKLKILLCCLLLSISLIGCEKANILDEIFVVNTADSNPNIIDISNKHRFLILSLGLGSRDYIFVDKETGVQYLFVDNNTGGGLTVLVDADGKPILYEGELE